MTRILTYVVAALTAMLSMSAWGQGAYVGVGAAHASADANDICVFDISCTADDSDTGFTIFGGYKFTPNIAIEGGYAGGYEYPISGSDSSLGTGSATSEVSGFNIAAVGILPLSDRFSLQGKAGIFYWDQDVKVSASGFSGEINESGTSPMFGVGGTFNFTQRLGILVEYSRLLDVGEKNVTGETDVDVFSASLVVNF